MEATLAQTSTGERLGSAAATTEHAASVARPYMNPYLAGIGLGLVLLSAFVLVGRGLGASGAVTATVAWLASLVAPSTAAANGFLGPYLVDGHPLQSWLVFEVLGVATGAVISGLLAHRMLVTVERGPRISVRGRLALAFGGGALMAIGAHLARGCTSGQALTGGSLLNLGSWAFMLCVFAGAYAGAWFLRREWR
ncbi:MAG: YeeE/YedE thiosulfate transporter family protein [bacterium]